MLALLRNCVISRLAAALCIAFTVVVPANAQKSCPIPTLSSQQTAIGSSASSNERVVDLRRIPVDELPGVIASLRKRDVPLVTRELLADREMVERLKHAKPGILILESPGSLSAHRQLAKPISGIQVVSGIPSDAEQLKNVYGPRTSVTNASLKQMKKATAAAARLPLSAPGGNTAATVLREARHRDTSEALIVLAHNDGGNLQFPDGSTLPIADFRAAADASGRPEVLISCESASFLQYSLAGLGTTKRIDFASAAEAIEAARSERTVGEFIEKYTAHYKSPQQRLHDRLIVVLTVGALLVIIAILLSDDDDEKKGRLVGARR
jgi:hypothetical protein